MPAVVIDPSKKCDFSGLPSNSIALDGVVEGCYIDPVTERYSFDHHGSQAPRLALSATCRQVFDALNMGLNPEGATIYLNHVDADSALSVWLLENAERWKNEANRQKLLPLLDVVAENDAHGPSYPCRHPQLARYFHTVVMQSTRPRPKPEPQADPQQVLAQVLVTLEQWWQRDFSIEEIPEPVIPPQITIAEHGNWVYARHDPAPDEAPFRLSEYLYDKGYLRLVLATEIKEESGGKSRWKYTLAKKSDFVKKFDIPALQKTLNFAEQKAGGSGEWGGTSTIIGSPRPAGSILPPDTVVGLVTQCVL